MATKLLSVCGWAECGACKGKPTPTRAGRVGSEAARTAVMRFPGWGALSCVQRRQLALAFDKFAAAQSRKGAKRA